MDFPWLAAGGEAQKYVPTWMLAVQTWALTFFLTAHVDLFVHQNDHVGQTPPPPQILPESHADNDYEHGDEDGADDYDDYQESNNGYSKNHQYRSSISK